MNRLVSLAVSLLVGVIGLTALPYLPGRHDASAAALSGLARGVGLGSVLLVPIGFIWTFRELRAKTGSAGRVRLLLTAAALVAGTLAVCVGAAMAAASSGFVLAAGALGAWGVLLWCSRARLIGWARSGSVGALPVGLTLLVMPAVVAGSQWLLAPMLTSFAWNRTMEGLVPLIDDLERYRVRHGRYPRSLLSEWCDYRPPVIGVGRYLYEPAGDTYNLAVEVPTFSISAIEYLVYNPTDAHAMASHDADLLQRTPDQLPLYRGYAHATALERPHWKLLSFD